MISLTVFILFVSLPLHAIASGTPVIGYLTAHDRKILRDYFIQNSQGFSAEPKVVFNSVKGLLALEEKLTNIKEICASLRQPVNTAEAAYYHAFVLHKASPTTCKPDVKAVESLAASTLTGSPSISDLFYAVMALNELGSTIDSSAVLKHVHRIKSKDSNPLTKALIFQMVSVLNLSKSELTAYLNEVPELFQQADQLDGQLLYYDRGLYTTAMVAQGISDLITASGEPKTVPSDELVKLINFLCKRVHSSNLRATAHLLSALKSLATNPHLAPVVISSDFGPATAGQVSDEQPVLSLEVTSLWGTETYTSKTLEVKAAGLYAIHGADATRTLTGSAERGTFKAGDKTRYQLSLATSANDPSSFPIKGRYELEVSASWTKSSEKRLLLGASQVMLPVHVSTDIKVIDPTLTIVDSSNDRHVSDVPLTFGQLYKASSPTGALDLELGFQLSLLFRLVDAKRPSLSLTAHQVFLQLTHQGTGQAITFTMDDVPAIGVADAKAYKVRLDPESSAADFDYLDGVYKMEVIIGDFFIRKPILWHVADLNLHFGGIPGSDTAERLAQATDVSRKQSATAAALKRSSGPNPLIGTGPTHRLPGIEHVFRPPERRAPRLVALIFTGLCILPFVGLLITWIVLGVNVRNFRFRLSNTLFHIGLIAIFALYLIYWLCLDMFTTLRYLAILGVPTFLAGNSALRAHLAARMSASGKK